MENQRRIAERALYAAARNTHSAATQLRKDYEAAAKKDPQASRTTSRCTPRRSTSTASSSRRIPSRTTSTSSRSSRARRCTAASAIPRRSTQYKWVRDHRDLGTQYYIDAARSVVQSYEAEARQAGRRGQAPAAQGPDGRRAQGDCRSRGSRSRSRRSTSSSRPSTTTTRTSSTIRPAAPQQGINAALICLAYLHVDDAIARFNKVMDKFCATPPARRAVAPAAKAKDGILAIYEAQDRTSTRSRRRTSSSSARSAATTSAIDARDLAEPLAELHRAQPSCTRTRSTSPAAEAFYRFYKTAPQRRSGSADRALQRRGQLQARRSSEDGDRAVQGVHGEPEQEVPREPVLPRRAAPDGRELAGRVPVRRRGQDVPRALRHDEEGEEARHQAARAAARREGADARRRSASTRCTTPRSPPSSTATSRRRSTSTASTQGSSPTAASRTARCGRSRTSIASRGDVNEHDRDVRSLARASTARTPATSDDYVEVVLRHRAAAARRRAARRRRRRPRRRRSTRGRRAARRRTPPARRWPREFALGDAEDFYNEEVDAVRDQDAGGGSTVKAVQAQIAAQKASIEKIKKQVEDKYIALDAVRRARGVDGGEGPLRRHPVRPRAEDRRHPDPEARSQNNDAAVARGSRTPRDPALKKDLDEAKADWADVLDKAKQGGVSNKWSQHALENLGARVPGRVPRAAPGAGAGDGRAMIAMTSMCRSRRTRRASIEACCERSSLCALVACGGGSEEGRRPRRPAAAAAATRSR